MIKKMLLALCLMFSAEARAQFAAGYAPVRPEAAPSGEEQQSVLFRQAPAPAEAAPRPAEPENIRKPTPYTGSIRILAQVNGDIITTEDINHRVRAFCMTTGIPYNRQTKLLIINKVMQNTIDEKLKAQEAARSQIEIGEKEIDNAVGVFCQNNGISRSRLSQMLKDSGVSPEVFREQLKTDLGMDPRRPSRHHGRNHHPAGNRGSPRRCQTRYEQAQIHAFRNRNFRQRRQTYFPAGRKSSSGSPF